MDKGEGLHKGIGLDKREGLDKGIGLDKREGLDKGVELDKVGLDKLKEKGLTTELKLDQG